LLVTTFVGLAVTGVACGGGEPVVHTVVVEKVIEKPVEVTKVVEKEKTVEKTVLVVATPTPTPSKATPVAKTEPAPQPKNPPGIVTMILVNLTGAPGSLPDLPMFAARPFGVGESLFAPKGDDWGALQIAESWDLKSDLSSVTIKIRKGIKFHNVEKDWGELTAEDMAWVINQTNPLLNPQSIAASAANFSALFGKEPVVATDQQTIVAKFNKFDVRWASNLLNQEASGGLTSIATSKKAFDEKGRDWLKANFVGTGPFRVVQHTENIGGTYEKVPYTHWRKDASIKQIKALAVPEQATRIAMMQTGEADAAFIDPKDFAEMSRRGFVATGAGQGIQEGVFFPGNLWETTNQLTGEKLTYGTYLADFQWIGNPHTPNDANNPTGMDDMEQARLVRTALAIAVDRDQIIKFVLGGVGKPVHVEYFSTDNPLWQKKYEYPYDPKKAEELLDQAGFPRKGGVRFEIPLFVGPELGGGEGPAGEIADAVAGFWDKTGLKTKVLKYAYSVYRPGLVARTSVTPFLTSCDDGKESYPWDWPKGLVMTSLTRNGFSCGNESPEILNFYLASSKEPDREKRIKISNEYLAYAHHWAISPGYVSVPVAYFVNPNSIKAWPQHLGNSFNSPENIVPAR